MNENSLSRLTQASACQEIMETVTQRLDDLIIRFRWSDEETFAVIEAIKAVVDTAMLETHRMCLASVEETANEMKEKL